ncbi:hypothetical protein F4802DRAFT_124548 [Xylaria palmicola]|nr:hypothetical protein F4802DRAFT_124548 [Xylaria palmicola]
MELLADKETKQDVQMEVEDGSSGSEQEVHPAADEVSPESRDAAREDLSIEPNSQPVRRMAEDCGELFERCLSLQRSPGLQPLRVLDLEFVRGCHMSYNKWASSLGVFASDYSCLDHQIRNHSALQHAFIRVLDFLRCSLYAVGTCVVSTLPPESVDNGIHEPRELLVTEETGSRLPLTLSSIMDSIGRLNSLAIEVRHSSKSSVLVKARGFASQNQELIRLGEFEEKAYLALQNLYPNAVESLRLQLVDTMADRYAKLQYEYCRMRKAPEDSNPLAAVSKHTIQYTTPEDLSDDLDNWSTLATNSRSESKRHGTVTEHDSSSKEPRPPMFKDAKDITIDCEWCFEPIPISFTRKRDDGHVEWTYRGREHYRRDLEPYICPAEDCCETRPSYPSPVAWRKHMLWFHSEDWLANLHTQPVWQCTAKHECVSPYLFPSRDELLWHISLHHDRSEKDGFTLMKRYGRKIPRPRSCCPFCLVLLDDTPGDSSEDAGPYQGLSAKRRRESSEAPRKRVRNESIHDVEGSDAKLGAMASHIEQHLYQVMMLSLQLKSAMEGEALGDGDVQGEVNASSSGSSTPSTVSLSGEIEESLTDSGSLTPRASSPVPNVDALGSSVAELRITQGTYADGTDFTNMDTA